MPPNDARLPLTPALSPRAGRGSRGEAAAGEGEKTDADRVGPFDWQQIAAALDERGFAVLPGLVAEQQCRELAALYEDEAAFRSRVVMARHNFGSGEYKYLRYPLPPVVERLRRGLYPPLAPVANCWHERMGLPARFPATLAAYPDRCPAAGQ